jgi:uncharacterized protein
VRIDTRFYAELNDFLRPGDRGHPLGADVAPGTTVKDLVEALGVPHTEIDVVLVNGVSVDFGHRLADGDRVSVYPTFEAIDVTPLTRLRPEDLRTPRFVLDVHLGRLARLLRLLGFDALWCNDASDSELARISAEEHRVLLTRDRGLLKRREVTRGYFVRETVRRRQLQEVLRRFDLFGAIRPFGRCLECNGLLEPVAKADVEDRLPPRTRRDYDEFQRCRACAHIYWKGSHYDALRVVVDEARRGGRTLDVAPGEGALRDDG